MENVEGMPRFKCHKEVLAFKIGEIKQHDWEKPINGGGFRLFPSEPSAYSVAVSLEWFQKHAPEVGGYFVRYEDGYESYSPAEAFESGYKRLDEATHGLQPHQARVVVEQIELHDKIVKLMAFITDSPIFAKLHHEEQFRLRTQLHFMDGYYSVLQERIKHFNRERI